MQELIEQLLAQLRGMWQRRWIGLGVAWLTAIIGAIMVFRLPDKYEASARVYVDTQSMLQPLMAGMAINPDPSQQVAILSRILLSRPNLEKIIRKSDLDTSTGRNAADLVDETVGSLNINRAAGGDNIYTIAFRYADGRKARDVVQAALSTFIEQSLGRTRSGTDTARKFIDDQIKEYESRLRESETRLQAFRLKYLGLLGTSGQGYVAQMTTVTEQIKDTRVELRVAEQTRDSIRKQLEEQTQRGPVATSKRIAAISVPELDNRINEQKRQLDEMLRKYTDQHPDVVGTKRLLTQLLEDRKREIEARSKAAEDDPGSPLTGDPVAQQLKVALNEAEANVTAIRARLGEYEARHSQLRASAETMPRIDMELTQLDRDYGIQKRQYESLVGKRETASLTGKLEDAGVAEFRIIDPPRVTPNPVAPNRLLLLLGVVAGSLFAGLATSWLVSQARPTFRDGRTLREVAQRPLLGMISILPTHSWRVMRRRAALLFAGGLSGLVASYGAAFAFFFLTRGS
ncbi:MAG TPA: XrtA system polysaccharide chain length determinant [Casimicrobiaceae bacterium]|jgi:polysaccharide chain length determinant protein (PEP-CTERM system associated)|nr:XrtA system polysaccharide chain length determinant [Casimicrobiaceae bacterium]